MKSGPAVALALTLLAGCTTPRLADFERTLGAQDSATAALGEWCKARKIADPPVIRAEQVRLTPQPSRAVQELLGDREDDALAYRHVRLLCGDTVLSEADNWYVPTRLTPEMIRILATTQTPFGKVVSPLGFRRERLSAKRGRASGCPRGTVLSHRALLRLPDGKPLSVVTECYTRANLAR